VVHTRRIAKVVKGGRRLRFNALVVVGDGQGRVGVGMGKALAIPDAVRKGTAVARRSTVTIPIKGSTIPHEISVRKGASIVIIKPAPLGTGIIAAGAMRAMLELGGVQDVVGKSLGSRNPINIVQATMEALSLLRDPVTERAARLGSTVAATNGATATNGTAAAETVEAASEVPAAEEIPAATAATPTDAEPVVSDTAPAAVAEVPPEVPADEPVAIDAPVAEAPATEPLTEAVAPDATPATPPAEDTADNDAESA
jgi:small subunit ribosomal protein S5